MVELKRRHGGRAARGEQFANMANSVSEPCVIPGLTNRERIERARCAAEEAGLLFRIREAARELELHALVLFTFGRIDIDADD